VARIWPDGVWGLVEQKRDEVDAACATLKAGAAAFLAEEKPKKNPAKALQSVVTTVGKAQPGIVIGDPPTFVKSVFAALDELRRGGIDELIYSRSKVPLGVELQKALATAAHWILWCEISGKLRQTRGVREIVSVTRSASRRLGLGRPVEIQVEGDFGSLAIRSGSLGAGAIWSDTNPTVRTADALAMLAGEEGRGQGADA
jgi:hypothetical protein